MTQALIFRAPSAMTAPGSAPRLLHSLTNAGASRRFVASTAGVAAGAAVTSLADLAGSGVPLVKNSAITTSAPTLRTTGTLSYLEFDGVDDRMDSQTATPIHAQPVTAMVVGRFRVLPTTLTPILNLHTNPSGRHLGVNSTGFLTGQFPTTATSTIAVNTSWHVYTIVANGATSVIGLDELEYTGDLGTGSTASITLGRDGTGTGYGKIDIAELIMWPSALSLSQRQAERANLKAAYGI